MTYKRSQAPPPQKSGLLEKWFQEEVTGDEARSRRASQSARIRVLRYEFRDAGQKSACGKLWQLPMGFSQTGYLARETELTITSSPMLGRLLVWQEFVWQIA